MNIRESCDDVDDDDDDDDVGYVQCVEVEDGMVLLMETIAINPPVFDERK